MTNIIFENQMHAYLQGKPVEHYIDTNIHNLKSLFIKIKKDPHIGNREFAEKVRPLILEQILKSNRNTEINPFWGAWYLAEDEEDQYGARYDRALNLNELKRFWKHLVREDVPGEAIGYALCLFCGLSVTDAMNARYKDIYSLENYSGEAMLHVHGSFPKKSPVTDYDIRPRFVPIPAKLCGVILSRHDQIREKYEFPVATEETVFHDALELPIACRGEDLTRFSRISGLSKYAVGILRDSGFDEMRFSYIQKDLLEEPLHFLAERSTAYALGRQSYGRMLHNAGINISQSAYLLGNPAQNEEDLSFYGDEEWIHKALAALTKAVGQ